jgi:hypothetical protein
VPPPCRHGTEAEPVPGHAVAEVPAGGAQVAPVPGATVGDGRVNGSSRLPPGPAGRPWPPARP